MRRMCVMFHFILFCFKHFLCIPLFNKTTYQLIWSREKGTFSEGAQSSFHWNLIIFTNHTQYPTVKGKTVSLNPLPWRSLDLEIKADRKWKRKPKNWDCPQTRKKQFSNELGKVILITVKSAPLPPGLPMTPTHPDMVNSPFPGPPTGRAGQSITHLPKAVSGWLLEVFSGTGFLCHLQWLVPDQSPCPFLPYST